MFDGDSVVEGVLDGAKGLTTSEWYSERRHRTVSLSISTLPSALSGRNVLRPVFKDDSCASTGGGDLFERRVSEPLSKFGHRGAEIGPIGGTRARSVTCPLNLVRFPKIWNDDSPEFA
jgi:hypothetical protein